MDKEKVQRITDLPTEPQKDIAEGKREDSQPQ